MVTLRLPVLEPAQQRGDDAREQNRRNIGTERNVFDPVITEGPFMPGCRRLQTDTSRIILIEEVSVHEVHGQALGINI
jgi:hypothetical protein